MPVLILAIAEDLDKLLENGSLAALAPLGKTGRVVIMAIHLAIVLIVAVLCSKHCGTQRAGKVINVVFPLECRDI